MRGTEFRDWLLPQMVAGRRGTWRPSFTGWRFDADATGQVGGRQFEVTVLHTGAVLATLDVQRCIRPKEDFGDRFDLILLTELGQLCRLYAVDVAARVMARLQLTGPVTIHCELNAGGARIGRESPWDTDDDATIRPSLGKELTFDETTSVTELRHAPEAVILRVLDHVAAAGGLWLRGLPTSTAFHLCIGVGA